MKVNALLFWKDFQNRDLGFVILSPPDQAKHFLTSIKRPIFAALSQNMFFLSQNMLHQFICQRSVDVPC